MNALSEKKISKALFISPVVNMERLIMNMMTWSNISEETCPLYHIPILLLWTYANYIIDICP